MTESKPKQGERAFADDLEGDPGIGRSKGSFMTGQSPNLIDGENTVEGDIENDSTGSAGVPEEERERTNP